MNFRKHFKFAAIAISMLAFAQFAPAQTAGEGKIANMTVGGSSVRWDILVPNSGGSVTITFPDGRSVRKNFRAGAAPVFDVSDKQLESLPNGVYTYELRVAPQLSDEEKDALKKGRGRDDDSEAERNLRRQPKVKATGDESGAFSLVNGTLVGPGQIEGERSGANRTSPLPTAQPAKAQPATTQALSANTVMRLRNHRFSLGAMPDQVIPDDLIVQGSLCAGLDCVNNEAFSFDTIRLKENNTRISFNDTSVGTFPSNDWTIRANSNVSGGQSFLGFVDRGTNSVGDETGTIIFEVDAGAPVNSLRVSSTGRIGLRTATPVLDVHANTSNTPGFRLEQNNSGGFTAQTWDIAGNEANFFVRDVTSGSRLPFRIRPGAPTSSIDIAGSGNVGINTASPATRLQVVGAGNALPANNGTTQSGGHIMRVNEISNAIMDIGSAAGTGYWIQVTDSTSLAANYPLLFNPNGGNVGINTSGPTDNLSVNGTASKPGGGTWSVFSDERLKNIKGNFTPGLSAVMRLQPLRYQYRRDNVLGLKSDQEYVGFGAQSLQKVIPEAVTTNANGYLQVNSDPILWTMLNAIKEQQKQIEQLQGQVRTLRTQLHRRRK